MEYRTIAATHIQVSTLCLGTMTFGNPVGQDEAVRLVHGALELGVNFIDTADMYEGYDRYLGSPGGVGETILGEALKDRRQKAVVTTKVGNHIGRPDYEGQGLSRQHILHQIDASLARLQSDYVDFYQLHRPDPDTSLEESLETMVGLIQAGKIRHWGFSNFSSADISRMVSICQANYWPLPVICQPHYNWLERDEAHDNLPSCREHAIAVTPYRPLAGGLLTGKYQRGQAAPAASRAAESAWLETPDDALYDRLDTFNGEAQAANLQPTQYAVRWLLDQPGIAAVVVGVKRLEQVEALLGHSE
jgi:L-glyceraldehyde 3-phosphate reductase